MKSIEFDYENMNVLHVSPSIMNIMYRLVCFYHSKNRMNASCVFHFTKSSNKVIILCILCQ